MYHAAGSIRRSVSDRRRAAVAADLNRDGEGPGDDSGDSDLFDESYAAHTGMTGKGRLSAGGIGSGSPTGTFNRKGYAGYEWDPVISMYHVRHRVYHPEIGRWTRRDPLGYVDGMGVYEYAASRAVSSRDATGLRTDAAVVFGGSQPGPGMFTPERDRAPCPPEGLLDDELKTLIEEIGCVNIVCSRKVNPGQGFALPGLPCPSVWINPDDRLDILRPILKHELRHAWQMHVRRFLPGGCRGLLRMELDAYNFVDPDLPDNELCRLACGSVRGFLLMNCYPDTSGQPGSGQAQCEEDCLKYIAKFPDRIFFPEGPISGVSSQVDVH